MIRPGCHNKPGPTAETTHIAQDGWRTYEERGAIVRVPVYAGIKHVMSTTCQYDVKDSDPGCAGCFQVQSGSINKP